MSHVPILDIALEFIGLGWSPVPLPFKQKRPVIENWQTLRVTAETARRYFNGLDQNIGVILGEPSHGLTDADLDCDEAVRAAPYLLPRTHCFGRAGKRCSHWLYVTDLASTHDKAAIQFKDGPAVLLEIRIGATGAQTMAPGSTHPSGEPVAWEDRNPVAAIDGDDLLTRAARLAAVSILAKHFPQQGGRHEAGLVVGGFLGRCNYSESHARLFAEALCAATQQDRDKTKDIIRAVEAGVTDRAAGKQVAGFPKLVETFGKDVAKKCAEWLGYGRQQDEEPRQDDGPRDDVPPQGEAGPATGKKFPIVNLADITLPEEPAWLIPDVLPYSGLAIVYGLPKSGKSFAVAHAVFHVALGLPWANRNVAQGSVVYCCGEGVRGFKRRMVAFREYYGLMGLAAPFGLIEMVPNLGRNVGDDAEIAAAVKAWLATYGWPSVRVLVIDTVSCAMEGADENKAMDMNIFAANCTRVARELECLVIGIHHAGKDTARGTRGSNALPAAADIMWEVEKHEGFNTATIVSAKDSEEGLTWKFKLNGYRFADETTAKAQEKKGEQFQGAQEARPDTCTVEILTEPATAQEAQETRRKSKPQKIGPSPTKLLDIIRFAIDREGIAVKGRIHVPHNVRAITREGLKRYLHPKGYWNSDMKENVKRAKFSDDIITLDARGYIGSTDEYVWLDE